MSVAYSNFIARVTGASAGLQFAYQGLLDGLTTDGLFNQDGTSSFFDVLYIFQTQDQTTALLNLVSSSFAGTANGSPVFTANQGFMGVDASTTVYIDTGFNPNTASSPKFVQNSAHLSAWSNTNAISGASGGQIMGCSNSPTNRTYIYARYSDGSEYFVTNGSASPTGITNADSTGHYLATRSSSTVENGYRNAVDQSVAASTSAAVANVNFTILAGNGPTPGAGTALQIASASIGASLTATQVTNFYNRLVTFRVAAAAGFPAPPSINRRYRYWTCET